MIGTKDLAAGPEKSYCVLVKPISRTTVPCCVHCKSSDTDRVGENIMPKLIYLSAGMPDHPENHPEKRKLLLG